MIGVLVKNDLTGIRRERGQKHVGHDGQSELLEGGDAVGDDVIRDGTIGRFARTKLVGTVRLLHFEVQDYTSFHKNFIILFHKFKTSHQYIVCVNDAFDLYAKRFDVV